MPQVQVIQPIQQQPKRLRVAAYARVSSDSTDQLNSLSVQMDYYTHLIQENPNWDFAGIYADEGITGTSTKHREQFNRLMDDCRAGLIDRVLVKSASRFARNTADALTSVRELKNLGVTVAFEKEGFDTETANGEMLLSMICAVAQEESLSISQNMKWGIHKRMQAGTYVSASTPFGYRLENHRLIPCDEEAAVVRLIFDKYLNGESIDKIAQYLNENHPKTNGKWHYSGVQFILRNEKYAGNTLYQKRYTSDSLPLKQIRNRGQRPQYYVFQSHENLVSETDFQKVQALLKAKNVPGTENPPGIFFQMVYCTSCGAVLSRKKNTKGLPFWICRKHLHNVSLCPVKPIYEAELCKTFLSMYNKLQVNREKILFPILNDLANLKYLQEQADAQRVTIAEEIQRLGKQNHNLERIYNMGAIESTQYWERRALIEQQLIEKKALLARKTSNKNIEKIMQSTKVISGQLATGPPLADFDKTAFKAMVIRMTISNEAITFELVNGMRLTERRNSGE